MTPPEINCSGAAFDLQAPLVLVVVPPRPADRPTSLGRADVATLVARGCRVEERVWTQETAAAVLTRLEQDVRTAVRDSLAVLVDVQGLAAEDALPLVECAWHGGSLTVLRPAPPCAGTSAPSAFLHDGMAHADVVVLPDATVVDGRHTVAKVTSTFDADDVLALIGPLDPPASPLTATVLITTYDRPEELSACLESLTRQTLPSAAFDVVIVDDASDADVTSVVEGYRDRLRTTLVRLPVNSGIGAARAAGVAVARGDVVVLLDDDDVATPRLLAEHLRVHHEMRGEDVTVLAHTVVQPEGGADVLTRHVTHVGHQYFSYDLLRDGDLRTWEWFWGGRSSAKRTLLERHAFRGTFMEDADWAHRVDADLRQRGTHLRVAYARRAVQVAAGALPLAAMRRRQTKMALASAAFRRQTGCDLTAHLPSGQRAVEARARLPRRVLDDLQPLSATPLTRLRSEGAAASEKRLARLDHLLMTDLAAHHALGVLAHDRAAALWSRGAVPSLGVDAGAPCAVAAAATTRPGDGVRVVVRLDPKTHDLAAFTAALVEALASQRRSLDDVGDVELRVTADAWSSLHDVDFVLPTDPGVTGTAELETAPTLFGLSAQEWVAWLASGGRASGALR